MTETLIDIIDEIEMCPMERTLVMNKFEESLEGKVRRKYDFLPNIIQIYINDNVEFRTKQIDGRDLSFQFSVEILTQYGEYLDNIVDIIYSMIPEVCNRNTTVPIRMNATRDESGWQGKTIFIGRVVNTLDNFVCMDSGLVLEHLGLYKDQFVLVVYNRERHQIGYTLLNIFEN